MSAEQFFKKEDLVKFIERVGPIDMNSMDKLRVGNITPYYVGDSCATMAISCYGIIIYPNPKIYTVKDEIL